MALEELSHKRRSIPDLIRFIGNTANKNKTDFVNTPNYSILLGAGASITSGVRSAQALVKEWKQEVYNEDDDKGEKTLEDYFKPGSAPTWYEEANSYSSLFENRYDLQRHRRMFVEREVSEAKPSMGYAYLVKLIEKGFFNTVFTTNFDDLLNEAFYRFSQNRPIVCAHDSSISGVTVTSSRPKIIKLHGDYLFENIKATLRETESLEANMKMKFQEFAKDFGLIVIGYSGQDRSIMDILNYLLQKEDYFKNGIFWCIMKGDNNIAPELKKLLWRDRVYFVEIEGFDELMAELNCHLNNRLLPIDDDFLSRRHQERVIKELTDNPLMNKSSSNNILEEDCNRLKNNFEDNIQTDFLLFLKKKKQNEAKRSDMREPKRKNHLKKLTQEEKKELDDLMFEGFGLSRTNAVLQKIKQKDIMSQEDSQYKLELLEMQADLTKAMDDETVKKLFEELIRLDSGSLRYYDISASRSRSHAQAIKFLELAYNKFPNDSYVINRLTDRLLDFCEEEVTVENIEKELKRADELLTQSLRLKPDIDNDAYWNRYRYLKLMYMNKPQDFEKHCGELCETIKSMTPHHPQTLAIMRKAEPKELNESYFHSAIDYYEKADNYRCVEKCYIEYIGWCCDDGKTDEILNLFADYESCYEGSNRYKRFKAKTLMESEYLEDALALLKELPPDEDVVKWKINILILLGRSEEAEEIFAVTEYKDALYPYYCSFKKDYLAEKTYYEKLIKEKDPLTVSDAVSYAYTLLQCEDYETVKKLLKPYYDNPMLANAAVIVNFLFARKKTGDKVDDKIKSKILERKYIEYTDYEKLGAYCVLMDKNNVISHLRKVIKKEPMMKYIISEWPIMAPFRNDPKIEDILRPCPKKL